jgi:hypothetical protein
MFVHFFGARALISRVAKLQLLTPIYSPTVTRRAWTRPGLEALQPAIGE